MFSQSRSLSLAYHFMRVPYTMWTVSTQNTEHSLKHVYLKHNIEIKTATATNNISSGNSGSGSNSTATALNTLYESKKIHTSIHTHTHIHLRLYTSIKCSRLRKVSRSHILATLSLNEWNSAHSWKCFYAGKKFFLKYTSCIIYSTYRAYTNHWLLQVYHQHHHTSHLSLSLVNLIMISIALYRFCSSCLPLSFFLSLSCVAEKGSSSLLFCLLWSFTLTSPRNSFTRSLTN